MKSVVLTNGCFDLFHAGHVALLAICATLGDVWVAVDSDNDVRKLKGVGHPIISAPQRLMMVRSCKYVTHAFIFQGPIREIVKQLHPTFLVKGIEWQGKVEGAEFASCVIDDIPMIGDISTSKIIERIRSEDFNHG
jgi:cytidyltransferase-like protein